MKDVSRERFDVNKEPIEPSRCWLRIRALLLEAAVHDQVHVQNPNQQNQAPLDKRARPADAAALQPDTGGARIATDSVAAAASPVMRAKERGVLEAATATATAEECAAVGEAQMGPRSTLPAGGCPETASADAAAGGNWFSDKVYLEGGTGKWEVDAQGEAKTKSPIEAYVDQCTWRVLHAASRTASGGDSLFVVQVSEETRSKRQQ